MKTWKGLAGVLLCCALLLGSAALADGYPQGHTSRHFGQVYFSTCTGNDDGYVNTDGVGGITAADPYFLTVISKSASIWSEPRTGSKKLGSASNGDTLLCRTGYDRSILYENGFYGVTVNGKDGWVNDDYVVQNTLTITLLESNVPAYIAPDSASKKVGSLSKLTEYRVIGFYDDYYIISLRGAAAAYVPMSVRHRDNVFESYYAGGSSLNLSVVTDARVVLRTGPGSGYPEIRTVKAGTALTVLDIIDDWFMVWDDDNNQFAFIAPEDLFVEGIWESVG